MLENHALSRQIRTMPLTYSKGMPLGTPAPDFTLPGVDGRTWSLSDFTDASALLIVFTCNHCPYAVALQDRLVGLQTRYAARGLRLVAINPNPEVMVPEDSFAAMKARAEQVPFNFPYLHDAAQTVAKAYDAACTPDIFLFDEAGHLVYNGRFDDNWRDEAAVTRHDLASAVERTLAGKPIDFEIMPSMGCSIKWLPEGSGT